MPTQQTHSEIPVEHLYNHPVMLEEYVFDMKKAVAIKLNDHYAMLTDGSCPSHHSPNDVIPFIE